MASRPLVCDSRQALDVLNLPTLMLLRAVQVLCHATVLPHAATPTRMLDTLASGKPVAGADAAAVGAAAWQPAPQRRLGG